MKAVASFGATKIVALPVGNVTNCPGVGGVTITTGGVTFDELVEFPPPPPHAATAIKNETIIEAWVIFIITSLAVCVHYGIFSQNGKRLTGAARGLRPYGLTT